MMLHIYAIINVFCNRREKNNDYIINNKRCFNKLKSFKNVIMFVYIKTVQKAANEIYNDFNFFLYVKIKI